MPRNKHRILLVGLFWIAAAGLKAEDAAPHPKNFIAGDHVVLNDNGA